MAVHGVRSNADAVAALPMVFRVAPMRRRGSGIVAATGLVAALAFVACSSDAVLDFFDTHPRAADRAGDGT
jgi:hypothetical protein